MCIILRVKIEELYRKVSLAVVPVSPESVSVASVSQSHSKLHLLYGKPLPFVLVRCPLLSVMPAAAAAAREVRQVRV